MTPDISVIIIAYNLENEITQCLDSVVNQIPDDCELILIDDGSTDRTGEIVDDYANNITDIIVFHKENGGPGSARNKGLELASGKWVMYIDGDDLLENDFFKQVNTDRYSGSDIVYFCASRMRDDKTITRPTLTSLHGRIPEIKSRYFAKAMLIPDVGHKVVFDYPGMELATPWSKLYRLSFIQKYGLKFQTSLKRSEDLFFNFQVYLKNPVCYYENIHCYIYRINNNSISHGYNPSISNYYRNLILVFENERKRSKNDFISAQDYYHLTTRSLLYCCGLDFCHKDNPKSYKERKKDFLKMRSERNMKIAFQKIDLRQQRFSMRVATILCKYNQFRLFNMFWRIYESTIYHH